MKNRIVITVEGGNISNVSSTDDDVQVSVIDIDKNDFEVAQDFPIDIISIDETERILSEAVSKQGDQVSDKVYNSQWRQGGTETV